MDLVKEDSEFPGFSVATIQYYTPLFERASTIVEVADRILGRLRDQRVFRNYNEIYFIAHSMGGLLVKRMLVDLNRQNHEEDFRRIRAVLYVATPAQGSTLAELASWFSMNPQLRNMPRADLDAFMQSLENDWQNLLRMRDSRRLPRSYCAYETQPTYSVMIVLRSSAATFCDANPIAIDADHIDIVKPLDRQADIYVWARSRIQDVAAESSAVSSSERTQRPLESSEPTRIAGIRCIQRPMTSDRGDAPFALLVTVQPDGVISPLAMEIAFDGPVLDSTVEVIGSGVTLMGGRVPATKQEANIVFRINSPTVSPEAPVIAKVYSKQRIRLIKCNYSPF